MSHGLFLLTPSHIVHVLGGKVANLVEKWELNKVNYALYKYAKIYVNLGNKDLY